MKKYLVIFAASIVVLVMAGIFFLGLVLICSEPVEGKIFDSTIGFLLKEILGFICFIVDYYIYKLFFD